MNSTGNPARRTVSSRGGNCERVDYAARMPEILQKTKDPDLIILVIRAGSIRSSVICCLLDFILVLFYTGVFERGLREARTDRHLHILIPLFFCYTFVSSMPFKVFG